MASKGIIVVDEAEQKRVKEAKVGADVEAAK